MRAFLLLPLLATLALAPLAHGAPEVELMVEGDTLAPSTTLEVRFAREMVKAEAVGLPATPPPLAVQPALAGNFAWLSKRSGVFTPTQEPAMGATYTISLRAGLKDAAGKPVTAKLQTKLKTPAFGVTSGLHMDRQQAASPMAVQSWGFNREVKLEGADKLFQFLDDKGHTVAATVSYGTPSYSSAGNRETLPWEQRWDAGQRPAKPRAPSGDEEDSPTEPEPRKNILAVVPAEPLSAGGAWRLEMKPGLRSLTGDYTLQKKEVSSIGTVRPFTLEKVTTSSYLNSGRSAVLTFSRSFVDELKDDTAPKFLKVTPPVKGLRFVVGFNDVTVYGDFQRTVEYHLEVSAELRDSAGVPCSGELVRTLRFGPVKPRIYLPVVDGYQMAGGLRKLVVTSVNMKSVRISAQLVPPEKTAEAITTFQAEYTRTIEGQSDPELYHRVAPAKIPGAKVFERVQVLPNSTVDERQELDLDWTELMGGAKTGTILLTIDGLPLDGVKAPRAGSQALLQMTDLGVLWKKVADDLQVTVFSMASGKPVAGAELALLSETYAAGAKATTDAAGMATLPVPAEVAWLTVQHPGDALALHIGPTASELPMAAFRLPIEYGDWSPQGAKGDVLRAVLFTERPLYKPGETAHVKGIVRTLSKKGLAFVAQRKGTLHVIHPHEHGSDEIEVTTDEHGAFHADVPLDPSLVGQYSLRLQLGEDEETDAGFSTSFLTADYQPNAFEVNLGLAKRFAPGAEITAEVSGRYFFGAPLGRAHAQWTLQYRDTTFEAEGFSEFNFGSSSDREPKPLTLRGEGDLAPGATLPIRPRLPDAAGAPKRGVLTVEVTDENQQTVAQRQEFVRDTASFYLGMKVSEGFNIGLTEAMGATAVALKPDGMPVPQPVTVKAELVRVFYETVRAQAAGPAMAYRTERREEIVETREGKTLVPVRAGAEWSLPAGETARFKPGHGGEYLLRLTAHDEAGRAVTVEQDFQVSSTEPIAWDYHNPAQVELVADKADYHPGDTARLLIKTPISGEAMVNIERDNQVLRSLRVTLQGNAPTLEIPILAGDGPNVFVSLVLIRGAEQSTRKVKMPEYRYGVARLHVSEPETALAVKITPRVPKVEPGQEVVTEVTVLEANGRPSVGAEVTFFAVDNGVLALTGYERPQPRDTFEKPFPLKIRTGLSLYELILEKPDLSDPVAIAQELANKGYLIGGGGLSGPPPNLRSDFPGTAIWEPLLKTDANGKVVVKFKAPDALTSYRLVAVAQAGTNRFGSTESQVQISKRLVLLSALGQFAHAGDTLIARAVVRNESAAAGSAIVRLELDGTAEAPAEPLQKNVSLQPGASASVDFPVKLRAPGAAKWKWTAQMKVGPEQLEDGLLASLSVVSPAPILHETYLPELRAAHNNLLEGVNPQLLEGRGKVQVTLSNTRLASLRETSQALLEYPYGCAEQTVSSLIPWLVSRDFGSIMPGLADEKTSAAAIAHGLEKLGSMLTEEGGLAYWPHGTTPSLFASAYATLALALIAKDAEEPPAELARLTEYLKKTLRGLNARTSRLALEDCALACWALASAGQAEPGYHEALYQRRNEMTVEARALLACAMMEQEKYSAAAVEKLLDPRAAGPECVCWFGSPTRERAVRLLAWSRFRPKDKEVARLTQELLVARVNGRWRTTQENAWALLALSQYFDAVEGEVKPVGGELTHGDVSKPFSLTGEELTSRETFDFTPPGGLSKLAVANPKKGALYGDVRFTVEPPVALQPRQDRGYGVSRAYYRLGADGSLEEAKELVVGDRVVVVLRLETPIPGHFVAIDDPLPSVLEAVNPDFKSQAIDGGEQLERDWHADYREVRADRVVYFCDHLPAGAHTFRYLARVRSAGEVMAPSTKAEEMYRPERFGLGAGSTLTSRAR